MGFDYQRARQFVAVFGLMIAAFIASGFDAAQAGICNQDGVINLYSANCGKKAALETPAAEPVRVLPKRTSQNISQRLQPVRFEKAVVLEVESRSARGIPAGAVRFGVRCFRNQINLAFYFPGQEMSDYRERSEILYQVDDGKEKVLELKLAGTSKNVLGVWEGYRAVPFLTEVLSGGSLYLNALNKQYSEIEVEFDTAELRERIGTVRDQCNL